jgi:YedE family putative selenium metabolism protein
MITALAFREWKPRGGSSPIIRFFLGVCVMIGALVFLGCPIRMGLRLAGGDLNALVALAGMIVGILVGVFFLRRGFTLGRAIKVPPVVGTIMPLFAILLLIFLVAKPAFIAFSESGPGSQHVPLLVGLGLGVLTGFMFQRTRFCSIGGWRDAILVRDFYLFSGIAAFIIAALVTNYAVGNFSSGGLSWASGTDVAYHWGFTKQAISLPIVDASGNIIWSQHIWQFLGMGLLGLAATLMGGCPIRNLILSGEGDVDAGVTVLGYIVGAAFAHNFLIASSGSGLGTWGPWAVAIGWAFCIYLGIFMREKA